MKSCRKTFPYKIVYSKGFFEFSRSVCQNILSTDHSDVKKSRNFGELSFYKKHKHYIVFCFNCMFVYIIALHDKKSFDMLDELPSEQDRHRRVDRLLLANIERRRSGVSTLLRGGWTATRKASWVTSV